MESDRNLPPEAVEAWKNLLQAEKGARHQQPSSRIDKRDRSMINKHARLVRISGFAEQQAYNAAVDEALQAAEVRADHAGAESAIQGRDLRHLRRKLRRIRWLFFIRRVWLWITM